MGHPLIVNENQLYQRKKEVCHEHHYEEEKTCSRFHRPFVLRFIGVISVVLMGFFLSFVPLLPVAKSNVDHTTYGWVTKAATKNADGTVSVTIMEVPGFQSKTYTTVASLDTAAYQSPSTKVSRADALVTVLKKNAFAEIRFDSSNQCIDMELIEGASNTQYGPCLLYG